MLLSHAVARGVAAGTISLAFRRWHTANVSAGDTMLTVAGVIAIDSVTDIDPTDLTEHEAIASGAASVDEVIASLRGPRDQTVFQIELRWAGPDPRTSLSAEEDLSEDAIREIRRRLGNLDQHSRHGAWTHGTLRTIAAHPGRRAAELAELVGREKEPLKLDIRKLKNLGLTHSLDVGYRIAPRGIAYLAAAPNDD